MNTCCSAPSPLPSSNATCPACAATGSSVDRLTVKALLTEAGLARLTSSDYRFCSQPRCPVVYFGINGEMFTTGDVRIPIWQKQPFGDRLICYCFGERETDLRRELERHGVSLAVQRVRDHVTAGRCACEVRNPKGTCCLGDLAAAVKRMMAALQPAP